MWRDKKADSRESRWEVKIGKNGIIWFKKRLWVPPIEGLKKILQEAHSSGYSIHPGSANTYQDLCQHFWWPGMKTETVKWVSRCFTC